MNDNDKKEPTEPQAETTIPPGYEVVATISPTQPLGAYGKGRIVWGIGRLWHVPEGPACGRCERIGNSACLCDGARRRTRQIFGSHHWKLRIIGREIRGEEPKENWPGESRTSRDLMQVLMTRPAMPSEWCTLGDYLIAMTEWIESLEHQIRGRLETGDEITRRTSDMIALDESKNGNLTEQNGPLLKLISVI